MTTQSFNRLNFHNIVKQNYKVIKQVAVLDKSQKWGKLGWATVLKQNKVVEKRRKLTNLGWAAIVASSFVGCGAGPAM